MKAYNPYDNSVIKYVKVPVKSAADDCGRTVMCVECGNKT